MSTTPFVKRMRTQSGSFYCFLSSVEDIGLNINERSNVIKMSHYALLDIPSLEVPTSLYYKTANRFNVFAIPGAFKSFLDGGSIKDSRVIIAESFQNYALNLEANLLSQSTYNPALSTTVAERVFWKWLKETGAIRWAPINTSAGTYWQEENDTDSSTNYESVVKCIGTISAGAVRTDTFGTYNETYVLVPTSFGQTPVYFKQVEDDNYYHTLKIVNGATNILGRETYTKPHPDGLDFKAYYDLADSSISISTYNIQYDDSTGSWSASYGSWWTAENLNTATNTNSYFVDSSTYIATTKYNIDILYDDPASPGGTIQFRRSKVDCMSIEFDLDNLKTIFSDSTLTFDDLAITYSIDDSFDFNAVLVYYSVYNKALDKVLATNLLGVLFLDAPSGNTSGYPANQIIIPSITKLQSGATGFGTSYSFRINIKSDYILDDTQAIVTDTTASQLVLNDFGEVFDNLGKTLSILNQQTGTLSYITEQYLDITTNQTNIENQISDLQYQVNDIARDITGTENAIAMFSSGDDPLVDSSIYMKYGKLGFFTNDPIYPAQFDVSVKVKDLIIENAVRDTSGNILLGYGSPLQIGSSTNSRPIVFYSGAGAPALSINSSNNIVVDASIAFKTASSAITNSNIYDYTTQIATDQFVERRARLLDTSVSNLNTTKADKASPTFTTSFGLGSWKFTLSGNNLVLKYGDASLFKFTTDGSILAIGKITENASF